MNSYLKRRTTGLLPLLAGLALVGCNSQDTNEKTPSVGTSPSTTANTASPSSGTKGGDSTGAASRLRSKILFITNSNADWWNAVEKGMQDGGKNSAAPSR